MIFDYIIVSLITAFHLLLSLLPNDNIQAVINFSETLTNWSNMIQPVSYFFPINLFFNLLASIVAIESSIFSFKAIRYIVKNVTLGHIS